MNGVNLLPFTPADMITVTDLGPVVWSLADGGISVDVRLHGTPTVLIFFANDLEDRPALGIALQQARDLKELLSTAVIFIEGYMDSF